MKYIERMRKQKHYELSFEPKSIWEYKTNTISDQIIEDPISKKSYQKSKEKDWINIGSGGYLSKFVTEYAKRIIEFFTKKGDLIIDPFAGRTRGLITTILERNYIGYEVIKENIEIMQQQYNELKKQFKMGKLKLINKSSEYIDELNEQADLIFTCPPYWDVEKYKSVDNQLSDYKTYEEFLNKYEEILLKSADKLKEGKFFVIVVADFRKNGKFYDFSTDTIKILTKKLDIWDKIIFEMSPAKRHPLYIQAITNLNMLKTHEYCLVFRKRTNKEKEVEINNEINFNRPLVKDIYKNKDILFWSKEKGKIDWIDEKFKKEKEKLNKLNILNNW
jgi:DNA modification methylase